MGNGQLHGHPRLAETRLAPDDLLVTHKSPLRFALLWPLGPSDPTIIAANRANSKLGISSSGIRPRTLKVMLITETLVRMPSSKHRPANPSNSLTLSPKALDSLL